MLSWSMLSCKEDSNGSCQYITNSPASLLSRPPVFKTKIQVSVINNLDDAEPQNVDTAEHRRAQKDDGWTDGSPTHPVPVCSKALCFRCVWLLYFSSPKCITEDTVTEPYFLLHVSSLISSCSLTSNFGCKYNLPQSGLVLPWPKPQKNTQEH